VEGQPRHDQRRDDDADVRAGVEDAGRQRALAAWKPFRHRLDGRRKVARLAESEREAGYREADWRRRHRVCRRRKRPDCQVDGISDPGSNPIDEPAREQKADRIGEREGRADPAVVAVGPADLAAKRRRQDAEDGAVDVVDRGGKEQQRADAPAQTADCAAAW
jgi:hypothetical protein